MAVAHRANGSREREKPPRVHPFRQPVARGVVQQNVFGYFHDQMLHVAQVFRASDHLARSEVLEHEVAESELLADVVAQFEQQRLRVFGDEAYAQTLGRRAHALLRGLKQERHLRVVGLDQPAQIDAGVELLARRGIALMDDEADVRNDAQQMLLVFLVQPDGLGIVRGQQDFGPRALAQHLLLLVERLFEKLLALLEHEFVDRGQIGRVVFDRVLDQQDRLHAGAQNVAVGVHAVFDQLDDRQDQVGVAVPVENVVDAGGVLPLEPPVQVARAVEQQHDGDVGPQLLDLFRRVEHVQLADVEHADHQIEVGIVPQHFERFDRRADPPERGRVAQVQLDILAVDLHVDAAVFLERISVVAAADEQYAPDASLHQGAVVDRALLSRPL